MENETLINHLLYFENKKKKYFNQFQKLVKNLQSCNKILDKLKDSSDPIFQFIQINTENLNEIIFNLTQDILKTKALYYSSLHNTRYLEKKLHKIK